MVNVPPPVLVTLPEKASGAEISCEPEVTMMLPVAPSPMVSVPPLPGAMVYLLALSKLICCTCLSPSSETVRGAVILPRKLAAAVGPVGTEGGSQLPATLQLPSASTFHCGGVETPLKFRKRLLPTCERAKVPPPVGLLKVEVSSVNLAVSKPLMPVVVEAMSQE